jgi:hypothetical protein
MTDSVTEAKARVRATISHWREARAAVNYPGSIPARLDELVTVTDRITTTICQDVVTEVEAVIVELTALRFPVELDDALGALERATLTLDGALGRLSRAASRAGFANAEDDLHLPPGMRIPAGEIADQLEAFVDAVEGIRPVLEKIAAAQTADPNSSVKQNALVQNLMNKASVKIEIIGVKTGKISLVDVSGVAGLARQLTTLLQSFVAIAVEGADYLSNWLSRAAQDLLQPAIAPVAEGTTRLVRRAAAWIRKRSKGEASVDSELPRSEKPKAQVSPAFDLLEVERMIERGEVPPANVVPFVTVFSGWGLDRAAMAALGRMTGLRKLELAETKVGDLASLANLTALQHLSLFATGSKDLSPISNLAALQFLTILDEQVTDLSLLSGLTALVTLNIDGASVSDLSPLSSLTALKSLSLDGARVSDLSPLSSLTALKSLSLDRAPVSDLSPLSGSYAGIWVTTFD